MKDCFATLEELNTHLEALERDASLRGVVLTSAKPAIFIAGADLHSLSTAPMNALREMVEFGLVGRIGARVLIGLLEIENERHEGFGHEAAAEYAEMAGRIRAGAVGIGLGVVQRGNS